MDRHGRTWLDRLAVEQGDEADEAFGGMVARMDMPPHARAGQIGRGHRFAAYPRCSTDTVTRGLDCGLDAYIYCGHEGHSR